MQKKLMAILLVTFIACSFFAFIFNANAQNVTEDKEKPPSRLSEWWKGFIARTYIFTIVMTLIATITGIILTTIKKDKLLKSLSGQLITIEMQDGVRNRGRLRVESEGIEVIAEKTKEGTNEKVSYILRKDEMGKVHALVRYLDLLTESEKEQRSDELATAYHPSIIMRLRRKIRNVINQLRRVATDLFNAFFARRAKGRLNVEGTTLETDYQKTGQQAIEAMTAADYDSLIDKLIGTRVIVQVQTTAKQEYVGVFKDYTSDFIELLDVNYKSNWVTKVNRDEGYAKHERGLVITRNGNNIVFVSRSPFDIILRNIFWTEGPQDVRKGDAYSTLLVIKPFSRTEYSIDTHTFDRVIGPFEKLQVPVNYTYNNYKFITFAFESTRTADIVMQKNYGIVRHRTEKYEPKLLDVNSLADALIATKEEDFILKGNPSGATMTIYNGHLTNMPRERMDIREVNDQISQRWAVDISFEMMDKKMRPIYRFRHIGRLVFGKTKRILFLFLLLAMINADPQRKNDPLLPYIHHAILIPSKKRKQRVRQFRNYPVNLRWLLEIIRKRFRINKRQETQSPAA